MARRKRRDVENGELRTDGNDTFLVLNVDGRMCHLRKLGSTTSFSKLTEVVKRWQYVETREM